MAKLRAQFTDTPRSSEFLSFAYLIMKSYAIRMIRCLNSQFVCVHSHLVIASVELNSVQISFLFAAGCRGQTRTNRRDGVNLDSCQTLYLLLFPVASRFLTVGCSQIISSLYIRTGTLLTLNSVIAVSRDRRTRLFTSGIALDTAIILFNVLR